MFEGTRIEEEPSSSGTPVSVEPNDFTASSARAPPYWTPSTEAIIFEMKAVGSPNNPAICGGRCSVWAENASVNARATFAPIGSMSLRKVPREWAIQSRRVSAMFGPVAGSNSEAASSQREAVRMEERVRSALSALRRSIFLRAIVSRATRSASCQFTGPSPDDPSMA